MNDAIFGGSWQDAKSKPPSREDSSREDLSREDSSSDEENDGDTDDEGTFEDAKSRPENFLRF